jgi:hypothetical protein
MEEMIGGMVPCCNQKNNSYEGRPFRVDKRILKSVNK